MQRGNSNRLAIIGVSVAAALFFCFWLRPRESVTPAYAPPHGTPQAYPSVRPTAPTVPAIAAEAPLTPAVASVEVCGVGALPLDANGAIVAPDLEARAAKNMARWQSMLINSSDVRARAVGLYLDSKVDGDAVDSLVQLVQQTRDPAVYVIALQACAGSCDQLSLQGWRKLDPDNAAPWLDLANAARVAKDTAAENAAFANAAKATKTDAYTWSLLAFAEADMPGDLSPLDRWSMTAQLIGIEGGIYPPVNSAISRHCSADAVLDENVRNQCDQVAQLLVTKGPTLLDFAMGTEIGKRVGWSALLSAGAQVEQHKPGAAWSCDSIARQNRFIHEVAQLGEIGATREFLTLSSDTRTESAAKYRDYIEKLMHR